MVEIERGGPSTRGVKTCPGLCCETMGPIRINIGTRGERIDEWVNIDLTYMDLHRYRDPWFAYMHDHMLEVATVVNGVEEYRCRLFDKSTGCCTIYNNRPGFCRTYPDEHPCWHCTYDPRLPDVPGLRYAPTEETGIFPIEQLGVA